MVKLFDADEYTKSRRLERAAHLQAPAHARSKPKHRKPKTALAEQPWIVRAILGIQVPAKVVGAVRGFLVLGLTALAEVGLTKLGVLPAGTWQALLPSVAGAWFVLAGALDEWAKPGANSATPPAGKA